MDDYLYAGLWVVNLIWKGFISVIAPVFVVHLYMYMTDRQ